MVTESQVWTAGEWRAEDIKRGAIVRLYSGDAVIVQASMVPSDDIDEWRLKARGCIAPRAFTKDELVSYLNAGKFLRVG